MKNLEKVRKCVKVEENLILYTYLCLPGVRVDRDLVSLG